MDPKNEFEIILEFQKFVPEIREAIEVIFNLLIEDIDELINTNKAENANNTNMVKQLNASGSVNNASLTLISKFQEFVNGRPNICRRFTREIKLIGLNT